MSDVIHHARPTASQQAATEHRARFRASIESRAVKSKPPVFIRVIEPEAIPVPVRVIPIDELAFGPIVYCPPTDGRPKLKEVAQIVCDHFGIGRTAMVSARRDVKYCAPRQVTMYLCHILTLRSYPEIGRSLGHRDHSTVINGVRKIQGQISGRDEKVIANVDALYKKITAIWPESAVDF